MMCNCLAVGKGCFYQPGEQQFSRKELTFELTSEEWNEPASEELGKRLL